MEARRARSSGRGWRALAESLTGGNGEAARSASQAELDRLVAVADSEEARISDYKALLNVQSKAKQQWMEEESLIGVEDEQGPCKLEETPLYILRAARRGKREAVEAILSHDPSKLGAKDCRGWTAIHHAACHGRNTVIDLLLNYGEDIDLAAVCGDTPLHLAAQAGRLDTVKHLMVNGANPNLPNIKSAAPIHVATFNDHPDVIEELCKHERTDVNLKAKRGASCLHIAAALDYGDCTRVLLEAGCKLCSPCDNGFYPLHVAAKAASKSVMEVMLEHGEKAGYSRESMLSFMDREANSPLHSAVYSGDIRAVRICLENGARVDSKQHDKATTFAMACDQGNLDIVKLMLDFHKERVRKATTDLFDIINAKDDLGQTTLHRAAKFDHADVVTFLIKMGAKVEERDKERKTALLLAAIHGGGKTVRALLDAGASVDVSDHTNRNILHVIVLCGKKPSSELTEICQMKGGREMLNQKDRQGCTPLHIATKLGKLAFLDILLNYGANINTKNHQDQSPLHFAARYGRINTIRRLLSTSDTKVINETDGEGRTALHLASMNGNSKVVSTLLQRGAILQKDYKGKTPLHLAAESGYTQTMQRLLSLHPNLLDKADKAKNTALHLAAWKNHSGAVEFLLSAGGEYGENAEGKSPLDLCIDFRHIDSALSMVNHERYEEILVRKSVGATYSCPLRGLIQFLPEAFTAVLDRSHTTSDLEESDQDYWEKFDFRFMQPEAKVVKEEHWQPLLSLQDMVKFGRISLLSHRVSLEYLNMKWKAYGWLFFTLNIFLYALFVFCLTAVLSTLSLPDYLPSNTSRNLSSLSSFDPDLKYNSAGVRVALIFLFCFLAINMLKEFVQIYQQRGLYFTDPINYVEWTLYVSCLLFVSPALFRSSLAPLQWECGAVAAFLAWFNLLMYLQRTSSIGIYVVMFIQIFNTIVKVLAVFSVIIIGFGITFFVLFRPIGAPGFNNPFLSIMYSLMMMMGDWNFMGMYVEPLEEGGAGLAYPVLSFFFLVLFVILMPILFVNLLIGLAVGDIEMVQRNAELKRLAMQVEYHAELEEKLPTWLVVRVDKPYVLHCPNKLCTGNIFTTCFSLLRRAVNGSRLDGGGDSTSEQADKTGINAFLLKEVEKTKDRVKDIQMNLEKQHELLRLIVQKMEISSEADQWDEGSVPGESMCEQGKGFAAQDDEDIALPDPLPRPSLSRLRAKMAPILLLKAQQRKPSAH